MGIGQGRQMKLCTSICMAIFLIYVLIYGEEEAKYLEKQYEQYKETRSEKELLRSRSIKHYNYSYMMQLKDYVGSVFSSKGKEDLEKLDELPPEDKQVILYFCQDHQWNSITETMFKLIDEDDNNELSKEEYTDFSQKLLQEGKDHQKAIVKQFDKIKGKGDTIQLDQFQQHMKNLQKLLVKNLQKDYDAEQDNKKNKIGNDLLQLIEQGIQLSNKKSEKLRQKREEDRFLYFSHEGNEKHWRIMGEGLFRIIDQDDNNELNDEEIREFLDKIDVDMEVEEWFKKQFYKIDSNLDDQGDSREFFAQEKNVAVDEKEFEAFSMRIYQLYMNYNGIDLKDNDEFKIFYDNNDHS